MPKIKILLKAIPLLFHNKVTAKDVLIFVAPATGCGTCQQLSRKEGNSQKCQSRRDIKFQIGSCDGRLTNKQLPLP